MQGGQGVELEVGRLLLLQERQAGRVVAGALVEAGLRADVLLAGLEVKEAPCFVLVRVADEEAGDAAGIELLPQEWSVGWIRP